VLRDRFARDSLEPGLSLPLRQELPVLRQRNLQPKLDWARTGGARGLAPARCGWTGRSLPA